ncbi:hypothetical protein FF36_05998 [Frankia torreyi]|uniref:Uncharacterized protein n=1 Tax=Frankia torreyi TaxID=1856 RepID=A0A0D8B650_9ACTN|nr:hypothetical protein [Frankia torreyi]KJE19743.1 hypothetical protein FF36_05998 [Frankia torreyi]
MTRPTREQRLAAAQADQDVATRQAQARILDGADALDPADTSLRAQAIRATAADIRTAPDVAAQREAVWRD